MNKQYDVNTKCTVRLLYIFHIITSFVLLKLSASCSTNSVIMLKTLTDSVHFCYKCNFIDILSCLPLSLCEVIFVYRIPFCPVSVQMSPGNQMTVMLLFFCLWHHSWAEHDHTKCCTQSRYKNTEYIFSICMFTGNITTKITNTFIHY